MPVNYVTSPETPPILRDFLIYMETIRGKSKRTTDEYFLDLRVFFRYMKLARGLVSDQVPFREIPIHDLGIDFIRSITLSDVYGYMNYLNRDRDVVFHDRTVRRGLNPNSRARKTCALRMFYQYLTNKAKLLDVNPVKDLETPKAKKTLPHHMSAEESIELLDSVDGNNAERDYCVLTFFLNCGLRVSELVGINLADIRDDTMRVTGKGNKERVVYLNDACLDALRKWLSVRATLRIEHSEKALFISRHMRRISVSTVKWLVKKHIKEAGLDERRYSAHKLRHTAATLMYQNGVDVRSLQQLLGHENLDTTKIYTHVDNAQVREAVRSNPLAGVKRGKRAARQSNDAGSEDS